MRTTAFGVAIDENQCWHRFSVDPHWQVRDNTCDNTPGKQRLRFLWQNSRTHSYFNEHITSNPRSCKRSPFKLTQFKAWRTARIAIATLAPRKPSSTIWKCHTTFTWRSTRTWPTARIVTRTWATVLSRRVAGVPWKSICGLNTLWIFMDTLSFFMKKSKAGTNQQENKHRKNPLGQYAFLWLQQASRRTEESCNVKSFDPTNDRVCFQKSKYCSP